MKLKFKHQAYQTNAVEAVADCFAGQSLTTGIQYRVDPGRAKPGGQQSLLEGNGFCNNKLALTLPCIAGQYPHRATPPKPAAFYSVGRQ